MDGGGHLHARHTIHRRVVPDTQQGEAAGRYTLHIVEALDDVHHPPRMIQAERDVGQLLPERPRQIEPALEVPKDPLERHLATRRRRRIVDVQPSTRHRRVRRLQVEERGVVTTELLHPNPLVPSAPKQTRPGLYNATGGSASPATSRGTSAIREITTRGVDGSDRAASTAGRDPYGNRFLPSKVLTPDRSHRSTPRRPPRAASDEAGTHLDIA